MFCVAFYSRDHLALELKCLPVIKVIYYINT